MTSFSNLPSFRKKNQNEKKSNKNRKKKKDKRKINKVTEPRVGWDARLFFNPSHHIASGLLDLKRQNWRSVCPLKGSRRMDRRMVGAWGERPPGETPEGLLVLLNS